MSSYSTPVGNNANISFTQYYTPTGSDANIQFGDSNLLILPESIQPTPTLFGYPLVTGPLLRIYPTSIASREIFGMFDLSQDNTFSFTGQVQEAILEPGWYLIKCWGARGNKAYYSDEYRGNEGLGGYSEGIIEITETTTTFVYVGGTNPLDAIDIGVQYGGWNGGGDGHNFNNQAFGGGGGGASDVRIGGTSLYDRIIVAAGGGGSSYTSNDGASGGGLEGISSRDPYCTAGTQTEPGDYLASFGQGGSCDYRGGGGGGGGWFGGGVTIGIDYTYTGGSGGSSYIGGTLSIDGHQFPKIPIIDGYTQTGVRDDYGLVQIFPVSMDPEIIITDVASILSQELVSSPIILYSGLGFSKLNSEKILLRKGYVKVNGVLKPLTMGYEKKDGVLHRLF